MSTYKNQFNKQIFESVEKNKKIIKCLFYKLKLSIDTVELVNNWSILKTFLHKK